MLERIRSIRDQDFNILLDNPTGREIYQVDSINLIIGDNGSGKTRLIRSIIHDLCTPDAEPEHIFDGDTEDLAVIYYTAAPFYKPFKLSRSTKIPFVDASPSSRRGASRFTHQAQEFLDLSVALGVKLPQSEPRDFSYESFLNLTINSLMYVKIKGYLPEHIADQFEEYSSLNSEVLSIDNLRRETYRKIEKIHSQKKSENSEFAKNLQMKLYELEGKHKNAVRVRRDSRRTLVEAMLKQYGPKNKTQAMLWVIATLWLDLKGNNSVSDHREFFRRFLSNDFVEDDKIGTEWNNISETVRKFIREITKRGVGEFKWGRLNSTLNFDLKNLLTSNISADLLDSANAIGLVDLGLSKMSSGEAAITDQLISISHHIHQLADTGTRSFVIFIDEGDLLLHLNWQRKYLDLIDIRLSNFRKNLGLKSIQIVVASHSPLLTSDVLARSITRLGEGSQLTGFGAPLQKIVNYSFGTPAIGSIAEKTIKHLSKLKSYNKKHKDIISEIDDDFVREYLGRKTTNDNNS